MSLSPAATGDTCNPSSVPPRTPAYTSSISEPETLAEYSQRDDGWDQLKQTSAATADMFSAFDGWDKQAASSHTCAETLRFMWADNITTGESRLKLAETWFCRFKWCPLCQARKSKMWQARFFEALPKLEEQNGRLEWIMLTLTVRNCPVDSLKSTVAAMNKAWQRLTQRKAYKAIQGHIKALEITRPEDASTAHPHFHVLLAVKPSYFRKHYLSQAAWTDLWQDCLRVDYTPVVDVRKVRARKPREGEDATMTRFYQVGGAAAEVLKYSTKSSDMLGDPEWAEAVANQTKGTRHLAPGGILKDVLKQEDQITNEDLIIAGEDDPDEVMDTENLIAFRYRYVDGRYIRWAKGDQYRPSSDQIDGLAHHQNGDGGGGG